MTRRNFTDLLEENLMALTLGLMTIITFANVVVRYGHGALRQLGYEGPGNILWALEATVFLFAWLVIIGASYAVKKNLHLGVDIAVNMLPESLKRPTTLLAAACCLVFTGLVLYGAFEYWLPFLVSELGMKWTTYPCLSFYSFSQPQ